MTILCPGDSQKRLFAIRHRLTVLGVALALLASAAPASAQTLYALEFDGNPSSSFGEINQVTGADVTSIGSTLMNGKGMATDPTTGTMYAVRSYKGTFDLVTIDPADGSTMTIGTFRNAAGTEFPMFRDLTFDNTGQLWGVTGQFGDNAQSVLPIDKATGITGAVLATIAGNTQMTIAYRPADGLLYVYSLAGPMLRQPRYPNRHSSRPQQADADFGALYQFESIDPSDGITTPISLSGVSPTERLKGLVFDPTVDLFRFFDNNGNYWTLSPTGTQTDTGNDNAAIYMGLAFDQATTVPVELMSFEIE